MKNNILKRFGYILLFLAPFILTSANCDKLVDPTPLSPGEMKASADIEGSFFATDAVATDLSTSYLVKGTMVSSAIGGNIVITLQIPKGTVPYTVNVSSDAIALIEYCLNTSGNTCTTYNAKKGSGSGTIKITSISPNLEGTFSGVLPQVGGGGGSRSLSSGEFKATF